MSGNTEANGARLLVKCLERNKVTHVFGIPGAKIDAVYDALCESSIRLVLCRHEQNAAFMAAAHGRLTGEPGVVIVTSGPGVSNLATGLLTATSEGDPLVAIGGAVPRNMMSKSTHQNADNTRLMEAATKKSVSIMDAESIPEIIENAFRIAKAPRRGACFVSAPQDILLDEVLAEPIESRGSPHPGNAPADEIRLAAKLLREAKFPVIFLGEDASMPENCAAIRELVRKTGIPVLSTFQGAGVISRELFESYIGRVGLFKNQPGDRLLEHADIVATIGFSPIEYDPDTWNAARDKKIIHIDSISAQVYSSYAPVSELTGSISGNISLLAGELDGFGVSARNKETIASLHRELLKICEFSLDSFDKGKIHPLQFIRALRTFIGDGDIVTCDIGSVYIWMARHFFVFNPRQLLFSNGQQTLGVALPWAIAAKLSNPGKRVFSVSGDGGFLFSSMELETAVREKIPFVHFIWTDGTYNMVLEQQIIKYGRRSGVDFGAIDIVSYAKAFGARGYRMDSILDFNEIVSEAVNCGVPALIDVPIDYSGNRELFVAVNRNDSI